MPRWCLLRQRGRPGKIGGAVFETASLKSHQRDKRSGPRPSFNDACYAADAFPSLSVEQGEKPP